MAQGISESDDDMSEETTESVPGNDSEHIERLVDEFFAAPRTPVTNHEEWLLRMAANLMEREAQISVSSERSRTVSKNGGRR